MQLVIYVLRRKPDITHETFEHYWREVHAPLVRSYAKVVGIQQYVQLATLISTGISANESRGCMQAPYDGVAMIWNDLNRATGTLDEIQLAYKAMVDDERHFIDFEASALWLSSAREVYAEPGPTTSALKTPSLLPAEVGARVLDVERELTELAYPDLSLSSF